MNNWSAEETAFRCQRLSVRLEQVAQTFEQMASLNQHDANSETVLSLLRINKSYLELTALDLDVDSAFELAQMQRQLSRWHLQWNAVWADHNKRTELSNLMQAWANQIREIAGVLV